MNTFKLSMIVTSLLLASTTAFAASTGEITFQGELTDTTCDVTIDGGTNNATVTLPTVSINTLTGSGQTNGRTSFNMNLAGCTAGTVNDKVTVSTFFQPGEEVDLATGRLKNTLDVNPIPSAASATNVQLQLLDVTGGYTPINVGSSSQVQSTSYVDIIDGSAFLPYAVEYYATGATTPGPVASKVTYNLQYK